MLCVLELHEGFLPKNELISLLRFDRMSSYSITFGCFLQPTTFRIYLQMAYNTTWFYVRNPKAKSWVLSCIFCLCLMAKFIFSFRCCFVLLDIYVSCQVWLTESSNCHFSNSCKTPLYRTGTLSSTLSCAIYVCWWNRIKP
jgi:hypothetical protein